MLSGRNHCCLQSSPKELAKMMLYSPTWMCHMSFNDCTESYQPLLIDAVMLKDLHINQIDMMEHDVSTAKVS